MSDNEKEIDDFDPQAERKAQSGLYVDDTSFSKIKRGDEVNLNKKDPGIKNVMAAIGWDLRKLDRDPPDLDASVFLLGRNDKTRVDEDFIFYNNLTGCEGSVRHTGDSRTGAGEGDDETVQIDLDALPYEVLKIVFVLSIYDLDLNDNDFTLVKNVYFRLVNQETELEVFRYEMDEELQDGGTGMVIGVMERVGSDWIFTAQGETTTEGLGGLATDYGIIIAQGVVRA